MKWNNGEFRITDDNNVADIDFITAALNTTYWAVGRPHEIVERSVRNSVMLSLFENETPIGFARIVSDHSTFAWLCDVYIDPDYRGRGLGQWLVKCTMEHPSTHLPLNLLATKDAHTLYEKFGYRAKECMILLNNGDPVADVTS